MKKIGSLSVTVVNGKVIESELSKPFEFVYTRWQVTHRRVVCVCDKNEYDL